MRSSMMRYHSALASAIKRAPSSSENAGHTRVSATQLEPPRLPPLNVSLDPRPAQRVRLDCREGRYAGPTAQLAPGFIQANLVVLERRYAFDFLMFTLANPKPCPLLDVVASPEFASRLAKGSDLRRDLPLYRLWKHGRVVDEPTEVTSMWPKDAVAFLLGCSFTFENELKKRGLLQKESASVPMYRTAVENKPSGPFKGKLVVSMRMFHSKDVDEAIRITEQQPLSHGGPVAVGWEGQKRLGISDLANPDFGEAPATASLDGDMVPVFWACGVTPQSAIEEAGPAIEGTVITHAPGCMFLTDIFAA